MGTLILDVCNPGVVPIVLVHARALLSGTPAGRTAYLDADLRDPDARACGNCRMTRRCRNSGLYPETGAWRYRDVRRPDPVNVHSATVVSLEPVVCDRCRYRRSRGSSGCGIGRRPVTMVAGGWQLCDRACATNTERGLM
ncbi:MULTISPECIES: SAM-dependent methyltransferase [unclassified Frankia]|uniref:SAM-dependent methyltransferase n=1 Tax=unclassified Frankia TaxID=2632575 RepID=UPI001EE42EAF|nr:MULTISPECIES: SAM-dependent methyltransferase [unclassified Frankia]